MWLHDGRLLSLSEKEVSCPISIATFFKLCTSAGQEQSQEGPLPEMCTKWSYSLVSSAQRCAIWSGLKVFLTLDSGK